MTQWNRDAKEMTQGEDGTYPVVRIDEHQFGYFSDTDQDTDVEYVEYVLASTTLTKYTYNATGTPITYDLSRPDEEQILSLYVQNINQGTSTFYYFDEHGAALDASSPLVDVKYIKAQIIVNIDPYRSPGNLCFVRVLLHETKIICSLFQAHNSSTSQRRFFAGAGFDMGSIFLFLVSSFVGYV